jgi:hypothetical protein
MSTIHDFLYVGTSAKVVQIILASVSLFIVAWAYARQALGFSLLKKRPLKSNKDEIHDNVSLPKAKARRLLAKR